MTDLPQIDGCVYGPVPSRRLGRSLGVDLVPFKTCTYDCVYCQLGRTTHRTVRRRQWLDPEAVAAAVHDRLASEPDVIALAGSGEPTLDERIGEVIGAIKQITTTPVAVITNGSLLGRPEVRRDLAAADIVMPSLDAPSSGLFQLVNRPHKAISYKDLVDGLVAFRREYRGRLWLEILLLGGVTGISSEVDRLAEAATRIAPDRIQLTTVVRPPAESFVQPVTAQALARFAQRFTPAADLIGRSTVVTSGDRATPSGIPAGSAADAAGGVTDLDAEVITLLARRPCSINDIAHGLKIHRAEALKAVTALTETGSLQQRRQGERTYYCLATATASEVNPQEES